MSRQPSELITDLGDIKRLAEEATTHLDNHFRNHVKELTELKNKKNESNKEPGLASQVARHIAQEIGADIGATMCAPAGTLGSAVCGAVGHAAGGVLFDGASAAFETGKYNRAVEVFGEGYGFKKQELDRSYLNKIDSSKQSYFQYEVNKGIKASDYYQHLNYDQKAELENYQKKFTTKELPKFSDADQRIVKDLEKLHQIKKTHLKNATSENTVPLDLAKQRNETLLNPWGIDPKTLNDAQHQKLHHILANLQKNDQHIEKLLEQSKKQSKKQSETQEARYQEAIKRETMIAKYSGVQAAGSFIGALGAEIGNRGLEVAGSVISNGATIALNAAMLSGAIPGVSFAGLALLGPYAAIGMAALSIFNTLFGRKKKNDNSQAAFQMIADRIQQLRTEMHGRFNHLEEKLDFIYTELSKTLQRLQNVLEDQIKYNKYAHEDIVNRLATIQADLHHLAQHTNAGLEATYLQPFIMTGGLMEECANRQTPPLDKIKDLLDELKRWLIDSAILNNVNGGWYIPPDRAWWSAHNLIRHRTVFGYKPEEIVTQRLGYLGQLISTTGINLSNVDLTRLPNIPIFVTGVEQFLLGRAALRQADIIDMDPEGRSIAQIQAVAENGIRFFEALQAQKNTVMNALLAQYHLEMQSLINTVNAHVANRLQAELVNYSDCQAKYNIPVDVTLPHAAMHNAGYVSLDAAKVVALLRGDANFIVPYFIIAALRSGFGEIQINYMTSERMASRGSLPERYDWDIRYVLDQRQVYYVVVIDYVVDGVRQNLFVVYFNYAPQRIQANFGQGGAYQIAAANHAREVARQNAISSANFARDYWSQATFASIGANNAANIEPVKQHIIHRYTQKLVSEVCQQRISLLGNIPENMSIKKQIIGICAASELIGIDVSAALEQLADKNYVETAACNTTTHLNTLLYAKYNAFSQALNAALQVDSQRSPSLQQLRETNYKLAMRRWSEEKYAAMQAASMPGWETVGATKDEEQERVAAGIDPDVWKLPENVDLKATPAFSLGKGGFGEVFKATDVENDEEVAVKLFYPGANLSVDARGELELITRLKDADPCDYIVKIMGISMFNGRYGMVMEFIPGGTLYHHLHVNPREVFLWKHRMQTGIDIVRGIKYLHARNIVHADIKSGNMMLMHDENGEIDGHAKVSDFGLSRVVNDTTRHSTQSREHISNTNAAGTAPWKAPEFFVDFRTRPSKQTDMWALGLVLWEIVSRRAPFYDTDGTDDTIRNYNKELKNSLPGTVTDLHPLPTLSSVIANSDDPTNQAANDPEFASTVTDVLEVINPVIAACRSVNPAQRPTAEKALEMLETGIRARANLYRFFGNQLSAAKASAAHQEAAPQQRR